MSKNKKSEPVSRLLTGDFILHRNKSNEFCILFQENRKIKAVIFVKCSDSLRCALR